MNSDIFLLLGSNRGQSRVRLGEAAQHIGETAGTILTRSSVYRSAAWGLENQPDFHNQVLSISTNLSPAELLEKILAIEQRMGRVRAEKWGPRLIDIDLLFYGAEIIDTTTLQLPHPGIPTRRFTLLPLAEIAGDFVHPVLGKSVGELLAECTDLLRVERVDR